MSFMHKSWLLPFSEAEDKSMPSSFGLIGPMTFNTHILKGQGEVILNRGAKGTYILSTYI